MIHWLTCTCSGTFQYMQPLISVLLSSFLSLNSFCVLQVSSFSFLLRTKSSLRASYTLHTMCAGCTSWDPWRELDWCWRSTQISYSCHTTRKDQLLPASAKGLDFLLDMDQFRNIGMSLNCHSANSLFCYLDVEGNSRNWVEFLATYLLILAHGMVKLLSCYIARFNLSKCQMWFGNGHP